MTSSYSRAAAITMIALGVGVPGAAAQAAETIKVTLISGYPTAATWVSAFDQGFVPAVDAALAKTGKYKVEWNLAHSGQVAKPRGEFEAIETGLGDIGLIPSAFHADKIPLFTIPYVTPFTNAGDPTAVTKAYTMLQAKFPEFARDFKKFNQVQIGITDNVDNYVIISSKSLKALSDLKGLKVGAAGPNLPWVTPTGAAGVSTNLADAYNSLNTGIYDAMIVWRQAMGAFKLCEPAPHMLDAGLGAASMIPLTVNADFWQGLPGEVKQAFTAASGPWSDLQLKLLLDGASAGLDKCKAEFKTVATDMPQADRAQWAKTMAPLALDWAKQTDAKGYPATQILNAYMDFMRADKQPVLRAWDKL